MPAAAYNTGFCRAYFINSLFVCPEVTAFEQIVGKFMRHFIAIWD